MKKIVIPILLLFTSVVSYAVPAKKGVVRNLTLADGSVVVASLVGDEYGHYWKTDDGRVFSIGDKERAIELSDSQVSSLEQNAKLKKEAANSKRLDKLSLARTSRKASFSGNKKGLVILVNFANLSMTSESAQEDFDRMFNEEGYSENNHIGSVRDYFLDQSYGNLQIDFDVVGPVTVSEDYAYYGRNDSQGNDQHPGQMVIEACQLVDEQVDFSEYDWDGDGEVDQVFLIYAGYGENSGAPRNTIWPHEYNLAACQYYGDGDGPQTFDGVVVDTYAVSCELSGTYGSTMNGIGVACHEFSHCLGYPDFYDVSYRGGWGMQAWDVLDCGSYSGPAYDGEVPCGYTAYERWTAGWLEPKEVAADGEYVLNPIGDEPDAYIIYNDAVDTEYYLLENRKPERWFSYLERYENTRQGMLVVHVDYSKSAWRNNTVNTTPSHQRMSVVRANNSNKTNPSALDYAKHLFPYNEMDSLTAKSKPSTATFYANLAGKKYLPVSIHDITVAEDGTVTFRTTDANADESSMISDISLPDGKEGRIFTIAGQCLGEDKERLTKGLYIVNGKKFLKD